MTNLHYWQQLANSRGLKLPRFDAKLTTGGMEKWLKILDISVAEYYEYSGRQTLKGFIENNPKWTLASWIGLMLEYQDQKKD